MKFLFKWAFRLAVLFVVLIVVLVLSLDSIFKAIVEKRIRASTGMDVQMGDFSVGLLSPVVNIRDFKVYNTAEFGGTPFLDIRELHLEYNRSALLGRQLRFSLMRLSVTELNVVKNDAGKTNFAIEPAPTAPGRSSPATNAGLANLEVMNLSVGTVRFVDLKNPKRSRELRPDLQNQVFKNVKLPEDLGGILSWIWFRSGGGLGGFGANKLPSRFYLASSQGGVNLVSDNNGLWN